MPRKRRIPLSDWYTKVSRKLLIAVFFIDAAILLYSILNPYIYIIDSDANIVVKESITSSAWQFLIAFTATFTFNYIGKRGFDYWKYIKISEPVEPDFEENQNG